MEVETFRLSENGWVPNNPRLPVLIYRASIKDEGREANAATFERLFADNHWPAQWRDTIYDYHHYHSTAHEVLGVASGRAILALGGPHCRIVEVRAGDTLILPVGTGHCRQSTTKDFYVVGGYPSGHDWDICRSAPTRKMVVRMDTLELPDCDPVAGVQGPLMKAWYGKSV